MFNKLRTREKVGRVKTSNFEGAEGYGNHIHDCTHVGQTWDNLKSGQFHGLRKPAKVE